MRSSLEIRDLHSGQTRVVRRFDDLVEAPNWDAANGALIVNREGRLLRVAITDGATTPIDTGDATHCNNDHGISPDGTRLVISDNVPGRGSVIYTLPAAGGDLFRVTDEPGAYWHGWSPDGKTLTFCGKREGRYDIYTIPAGGGAEKQLTGIAGDEGHNDGPDYSVDGRWIWFNSDRIGHAQIWKMRPDGTEVQQVFADEHVNWFPHPSPDGAWVLYLAYPPGTTGHPPDRDVRLCLIRPDGTERREPLRFNGGQGTINVPCWAPDGSAFAFVRYAPPGS